MLRACLVRTLVCLAGLQGMAFGVFAAIGPFHAHAAKGDATHLGLVDFRRATKTTEVRVGTEAARAVGPVHRSVPTLRHPPAHADISVIYTARDISQQAGGDDLTISPALAAFVALLPGVRMWAGELPSADWIARAGWTPPSHDPAGLERPPRTT